MFNLKDLIRYIRTSAHISQEQFANALGTTVLSVNRWENGKALPSKIAQKQISQFCKNNNIDIAKKIIENKTYTTEGDKLILYHGSKRGIIGEITPSSRMECDFGKGFYMGTNALQPLTLVCTEDKPKFYTLEFDLSGLKVLHVDISLDWAMLIAYYRKEMESAKGTPIYERFAHYADGYDVIVGYIANDRMYTELSRFFNRTLTDTALVNCLSALDLGMQYVAITQKACDQIKILREDTLSSFELDALMDMSIIRRKQGIELAEEIEIKYRREGRFFDEILRGE